MAESSKEKKEKTKSFMVRLASSIVLLSMGAAALYLGGWVVAVFMLAISLGGVFELLRVFQLHKSLLAVLTYIFTVLYYLVIQLQKKELVLPVMVLYLLLLLTVYVFKFPKYEIKQMACVFFAFFYVAVLLSYIVRLRQLKHGALFTALILLCACGNDSFAYLTGILIGKHKMFPNLSPKKSVEGFIGGIIGAAACGLGYGFIFRQYALYGDYNYPLMFALICGVGALPAVVGDLAASAIKRNYGIKDYSNLIPGHGGIMDRFDSMIFTAPIIYYLVTFLLQNYF